MDNELFLKAVEGQFEKQLFLLGTETVPCSMQTLFGRATKWVKAGWYSGKLRIPNGNMTLYEHNGYDSRFEKEIIITIEQGKVTKMVTLDNTRRTLRVN